MNSIKKIFLSLQGKWHLSRRISGSHMAHATGSATFEETTHPNELQYSEDVEITLNEGTTFNGYQHYIYRLEDENKLNVYFSDGLRLFHSIEGTDADNTPEHKASHYCQPDTYATSYFFSESAFQIEHRVNGPQKNYVSYTTYHR